MLKWLTRLVAPPLRKPRLILWQHVYLYGPERSDEPYRVYFVELTREIDGPARFFRIGDTFDMFVTPEYETYPLVDAALEVHVPAVFAKRSDAEVHVLEYWPELRKIPLTALPEPIPHLIAWYSRFGGCRY